MVQHQPLYWDAIFGCWVASSALTVQAILAHPLARVRPVTEPVPAPLVSSLAGGIFSKLIRMNDGKFHQMLKPVVAQTLAYPNLNQITQLSLKWTRLLGSVGDFSPIAAPGELTKLAFQLPIYVMGSLLGLADQQLFQMSNRLKDFVQCLTIPANHSDQLEAGNAATAYLLEIFNTLLTTQPSQSENNLLSHLAQEARTAGCCDPAIIAANAIGFLSQTYEATAGLIGNTLVTLTRHPEIRAQLDANPELIRLLVQEVLRFDPPVQNTRRFLAGDIMVAGQRLGEGEMVLVLLAAANRDPLANSEPNRFDLLRKKKQNFSFGTGLHACPGHWLAGLIAETVIEELFRANLVPKELSDPMLYRPSINTRIPII